MKRHTLKKRATQIKGPQIKGHIIKENQAGWKTIHIEGSPYERGFAHGYLLYDELANTLKIYPFIINTVDAGKNTPSFDQYLETARTLIKPIIKTDFPEIYEELEGIAAGAVSRGTLITIDFLIAWNSYMSLYTFNKSNIPNRCSVFIATGNSTETGEIIMAHTTHTNFLDGQLMNIILFMTPDKGHSFVMQTAAGLVASFTDWFICSTGIIGCESTISEINYQPKFGAPFFCRIRTAMQYATTMKEYTEIMLKNNAGDYPCSWLFGDINTNEIMLFEITLKESHIQKTKNGIFFGMNSTLDHNIRMKETKDEGWNDIETTTGARAKRLNHLLYDKYFGKINVRNAKKILADHYDAFLHQNKLNDRSICVHYENQDVNKNLYGCTDAKVTSSTLAKQSKFFARFGSACGRTFSMKKHIRKYPKYKKWKPYVHDFPSEPWVTISG